MRTNALARGPGNTWSARISPCSSRSSTCSSATWIFSFCPRWCSGCWCTSAVSRTWQKPLSSCVTCPITSLLRERSKLRPPALKPRRMETKKPTCGSQLAPSGKRRFTRNSSSSSIQAVSARSTVKRSPGTTRCAVRRAGPANDHTSPDRSSRRVHTLRGETRRPSERPHVARPLEQARALLQHRLLEVAPGNPDVLAERQQLGLGEPVADVALAGLELGGALDDALERLAADEIAAPRHG